MKIGNSSGQRKVLTGTLQVPGDKSISHRAAMLLAVANGQSIITNYAPGDDCRSTVDCLRALGVVFEIDGSTVVVNGTGIKELQKPVGYLDCGNSGTTVRLLSGILTGTAFETILKGDDSLSARPMNRIIEPLKMTGAEVSSNGGKLPITITGLPNPSAINYEMAVASAQIKSCVLLTGLAAAGETVIKSPPAPFRTPVSRDHTERMLRYLGAELEEHYVECEDGFSHIVSLKGPAELTARNIDVPGDVSSGAFFLVAAAGLPGSDVTLCNVGLNPTRTSIVDVLKECGVRITVLNEKESCGEPRGDLRVSWDVECELINRPVLISGSRTAALIDEIPILAVLGTLLPGGLEVRDAQELRIKESDRIDAVVKNLKRMNAHVEEFDDGFRVSKSRLAGAALDSYHDHRIAMAFSVAAMFAAGESVIEGLESISVSYPGFFEDMKSLGNNG